MDFKLKITSVLVICIIYISLADGAKFLTEKPSFLSSCKTSDPSFTNCLANNFQGLFQQWKKGIPGLKSFGTLDPLHIKKIKFHHNQPPIDLHIHLQEVDINGLGDVKATETSFDPKKLSATIVLVVPNLKLQSDYSIKGKTRHLTLDGNGKLDLNASNMVIHLKVQLKLRESDGLKFGDIEKLNLNIKEVGDLHIHLDNLFNGQKELESSVNDFLNQSWRSFYEAVRPGISAAIEAVVKDRLPKAFAYIPANYFIEDIDSL